MCVNKWVQCDHEMYAEQISILACVPVLSVCVPFGWLVMFVLCAELSFAISLCSRRVHCESTRVGDLAARRRGTAFPTLHPDTPRGAS